MSVNLYQVAVTTGHAVPVTVTLSSRREFERLPSCGILAAGLARIQCEKKGCTSERLGGLAFLVGAILVKSIISAFVESAKTPTNSPRSAGML